MAESKDFFSGPPKTMFWFGFVSGIAVAAVVAFIFVAAAGSGSNTSATGANNRAAAGAAAAPTPTAAAPTPTAAPAGALPEVTEDDWVRGDLSKAKVVMIEYSDYECPFCERHHPTMQAMVDQFGDDVAWVYRHFPLSFHPNATPAAIAAECVGNQLGNDAFWEFSDGLFANQGSLNQALYERLATELGADIGTLETCQADPAIAQKVTDQQAGGSAAGVRGTPATFINGQMLSGAVPVSSVQAVVEAAL